MTLTRQHFKLIAQVIAEHNRTSDDSRWVLACRFADALARTNSRFDREKFLRACGVTA